MGNILWPSEPGTLQMNATIYYEDRRQYYKDGCNGFCEEKEVKTDTMWLVIRCLYCHTQMMSCRYITQRGTRCRREGSEYSGGLCSHHSSTDKDRIDAQREETLQRILEHRQAQ